MMAIGLMELRAIYLIVVGWQYTLQSEQSHFNPCIQCSDRPYYCMTRLWLTSHKTISSENEKLVKKYF